VTAKKVNKIFNDIKEYCENHYCDDKCKWFDLKESDCYWRLKLKKIPRNFKKSDKNAVIKQYLIWQIES